MGTKYWKIAQPDSQWTKMPGLTNLASQVVNARELGREYFVEDGEEVFTENPPLADMELAVNRIRSAIALGEKIAIYGDYDCDGITSTVLLYSYLEAEGADVSYYIPDRDKEGYGLNLAAIKSLEENGIQLVITVDNGISAIEEIAYANSLGVDVIVTDHHRPREVLPEAVAVVNPHRKDCPSGLTYLCGVGVVFELLTALEGGDYELILDQYADIIAIGTVADIVPLKGKNRLFVQHGLELIQQRNRVGIDALLTVCSLRSDSIVTSETLAYSLIPRINAAGRLGDVEASLVLLLTEDYEQANYLAKEISAYNDQRKELETQIIADIGRKLEEDPALLHKRVLLLSGENWHHGVIGIVCSKLVERYGKPCILLSIEGQTARGSARSVDGFSMIEAVTQCQEWLTRFGGHPMAAGMSLKTENIGNFTQAMYDYAKTRHQIMPHATLRVDCLVDPKGLTVPEVEGLKKLEPFGEGNETPVFMVENVDLIGITPLSAGKHIKIKVNAQSSTLEFLYFGMTAQRFSYVVGDKLDIIFSAEINEYNGTTSVSLKVKDLRLAETPQEEMCRGEKLFAMYCDKEKLSDFLQEVIPQREDAVSLYKWMRKTSATCGQTQQLYVRAKCEMGYCKFKILLEVMEELELIELGESISLTQVSEKKDFNRSGILQRLRGE